MRKRRGSSSIPPEFSVTGDSASTDGSNHGPWPRLVEDRDTDPQHYGSNIRRRALIATSALLGTGVLLFLAQKWISGAVAWLRQAPEYRLSFEKITLEPEPPSYIKTGTTGILARVKKASNLPSEFSSLGLNLNDLAHSFAMGSPWVEEVRDLAVTNYPNRLVVRLRYRRPVAYIALPVRIILDHKSVVLPSDDLDLAKAGPLVQIWDSPGPIEPRAGLALCPGGSQADQDFRAGAQLAAYVIAHGDEIRQPEHRLSDLSLKLGAKRLSLYTESGIRIAWGEPPGEESPGRPSAARKWEWLRLWLDQERLSPEERLGSYVGFTRDGLVVYTDPKDSPKGDSEATQRAQTTSASELR